MEVTFDNPQFLWFLLAIPVMIIAHYYDWKSKKKESLMFSNFEAAARVFEPTGIPSYTVQLAIRLLIFLCLVFSAAGLNFWYVGPTTDINFVIGIDTSSSMSAEDVAPSRIEAAKESAIEFIDSLPSQSEVGVVSFAGVAFIEQPLEEETGKAKTAIRGLELKPTGGTDLGSAIITASNLLIAKEKKSRAILIITDGQSTVGIPVRRALDYAIKYHITINTIGIGTVEGGDFFGEEGDTTQLDETTLEEIATATGGIYYEAISKQELREIYQKVTQSVFKDIKLILTPYLIMLVLILLIIGWVLSFTKFSSLP